MSTRNRHVTIIGAGIVGVCCAAWLQRKGFGVTLLDREQPGSATSSGNAGVLSPSAVLPVAMPGMLRQVPGWLIDPKGPLTIRWQHLPALAPWLWRFLRRANPQAMQESAEAMSRLVNPAFDCYEPLLRHANAESLVRGGGSLYVYASQQEVEEGRKSLALHRRFGMEFREASEADIRRIAPSLDRRFRWGVVAPDNRRIVDPRRLTRALAEQVCADGGTFRQTQVSDIGVDGDGRKRLRTSEGEIGADHVLIAAGAWSAPLAARCGDDVPLQTQRGYHVSFERPGIELECTVSWVRRRIFVNPMETGLRIAGTVELASLSAAPNWQRADALAGIAAEMFPGLDASRRSNWMGHRPCLPDSLPVIGRATHAPGVYYAFGHQHVGMCSAAATGRSVAELINGETPAIDITPFRPTRF